MKTNIFIILIAVAVLVPGCSHSSGSKKDNSQSEKAAAIYTCTMHPEVRSDKPGTCPKCGMELVKVESPSTDSTDASSDSLKSSM